MSTNFWWLLKWFGLNKLSKERASVVANLLQWLKPKLFTHSVLVEKSETATCLDCSKPVENEDRGIKCSLCGLWIHLDCISGKENELGISPEIYERLSEGKYEFHCPRCKSTENPFFLQSLYDTKIVSREEAKDYVVF